MSTCTASFDFDTARFNMIEQQIRPWNVLDGKVLALLGEVKREQFVPAAYQALALADMALPLTPQGDSGPCMLNPKVEARALQDLQLKTTDKVLEIGTGSGYLTALLAKQCAHVTSLELDADLATQARKNLQQAGIVNAEVRQADAAANRFAACAVNGPYDAIVLGGSVAEVPSDLLDLLKTGGRLFAVVGQEPVMQATLIQRTGAASFETTQPWDITVPRLSHFPEPSRFSF